MAVFSKTDADLPLLTQVYQLAPEKVEEVASFWYARDPQRFSTLDDRRRHTPEGSDRFYQELAKMQRSLTEAHQLCRSVMDRLYDRQSLTVSQIWQINEFMQRHPFVGGITWFLADVRNHDISEEPISLDNLDTNSSAQFFARLSIELLELVENLKNGKHNLRKCEECQNVFVSWRSEQSYCSKRCANTAGERRRRQNPHNHRKK